jgi:hypothetical protein
MSAPGFKQRNLAGESTEGIAMLMLHQPADPEATLLAQDGGLDG